MLEYFTAAYNTAEGLISLVAGFVAGSVSLVGFGLDSIIEVTSGTALLWRLHHDLNESRREAAERITLRIVGWCFVALAVYVGFDSAWTLVQYEKPEKHSRHRCGCGVGRGHASAGKSEAPSGGGNWKCGDEGGLKTD